MSNENDKQHEQLDLIPTTIQKDGVIIKFETSKESLDANLMGNVLLSFNASIIAFAQSENLDNPHVNIQDVKSGCVEIGAVIATLQSAGVTAGYIATIFENLKSLYGLYQHLKGLPPKKMTKNGDKTVIENNFGENNTYNNLVVNQYIYGTPFVGNGEQLLKNDDIKSVSILDEKRQQVLSIPRDNFSNLIPYKALPEAEGEQIEQVTKNLTVAKIPLDKPRSAWSFIEDGQTISAKIEDDGFIKQIENGSVAFRQGDKIDCELEVLKQYNASLDTFVIKKRTIHKILKYTPRITHIEPELF